MKKKIEYIKKWSDDPQALVDRINANPDNFRHFTYGRDSLYYPKTIYRAELRFEKYVHLCLGGNDAMPIFEGVDRIGFIKN